LKSGSITFLGKTLHPGAKKFWIKKLNQINKSETFGFNNDFIGIVPISDSELLMWVNHEYVHPVLVSGHIVDENFYRKTKEQASKEMESVGGSILHLKKENEQWKLNADSKYNRRINAFTKIPFSGNSLIKGQSYAIGTLGNCAGGVTPWKTFLSCEENYHNFFGETEFDKDNKPTKKMRIG
jgi:secreted PhoX family phosphatase